MSWSAHEYVDRQTGEVRQERFLGDFWLQFLVPETPGRLYRLLSGRAWPSRLLAWLNFDRPLALRGNHRRFMESCGLNLSECCHEAEWYCTLRRIFERQIRYWECRPMPLEPEVVVSPADARVLPLSLKRQSHLYIKQKFFDLKDLLHESKPQWLETFKGCDALVFRLTPDKYHFNHAPVAGRVVDFYEIDGALHACNPGVVSAVCEPYSKNRRVVTIIDTDLPGGTWVGKVAMIEIVALMIGRIDQCYSNEQYLDPQPVTPGLFLRKGAPKSLFRPGSSTTVLLFEPGRMRCAADIEANARRRGRSRFHADGEGGLLETDVLVRSLVGYAQPGLSHTLNKEV